MVSWLQRLGVGSTSPTLIPKSSKKTDWGELLQFSNDGYYQGDGSDTDYGPQTGGQYGGAGLIFLGRDYSDTGGDSGGYQVGSSWAKVDPYLLQESQYGTWKNLRGDFENKLNEVANYSADALEQMNAIYDQLSKTGPFGLSGGASYAFNARAFVGSGDHDTASSNRAAIESGLQRHAQNRQQYDNLVSQFNSVYTGAVQAHQQREREHQERLAELERQRQAAEAAAARHRAWQSNMPLQNRQNENLPDTISAGTADSADGGSDIGGDVGGKPRRRRGSLSSNLGINV